MAGTTGSSVKAPKAMSSKLLTMKFMQRAAASSPLSSPATKDVSSPRHGSGRRSSPINSDIESLADQHAIQAAVAAEEAKRQAALDRQAADAGDTRWVLSFKPDVKDSYSQTEAVFRVVRTGFAGIDYSQSRAVSTPNDEDRGSDRHTVVGRRSYGKFNRTIEKLQDPTANNSSESDSAEDEQSEEKSESSDDGDRDSTDDLIRAAQEEAARKLKAERKEKRKAEKAEALKLAEKRKKKEVKLNQLASISGGSKGNSQTCYHCGQAGHRKADCPKRERDSDGEERGHLKKSRKLK